MNRTSPTLNYSYNLYDKDTSVTDTYKAHIERINERQSIRKCLICGKVFSYKSFLKIHVASAHKGYSKSANDDENTK